MKHTKKQTTRKSVKVEAVEAWAVTFTNGQIDIHDLHTTKQRAESWMSRWASSNGIRIIPVIITPAKGRK